MNYVRLLFSSELPRKETIPSCVAHVVPDEAKAGTESHVFLCLANALPRMDQPNVERARGVHWSAAADI